MTQDNTINRSEESCPVNIFLSNIENWINNNKLNLKRVKHQECEEILNMSIEELEDSVPTDLLNKAYVLYGYADYLSDAYNNQKMVNEYAEQSISYIIAPIVNNYGDQYTKWEIKYNSAIRENPLTKKLNQLKGHSNARLTLLQNKSEHVRRMADLIVEISRRKKNEYYSNS